MRWRKEGVCPGVQGHPRAGCRVRLGSVPPGASQQRHGAFLSVVLLEGRGSRGACPGTAARHCRRLLPAALTPALSPSPCLGQGLSEGQTRGVAGLRSGKPSCVGRVSARDTSEAPSMGCLPSTVQTALHAGPPSRGL